MNGIRCNPGWEDLERWLNSIDMSGPTPGLFRVKRDGERVALEPMSMDELVIEVIAADRERLIDEARD